MKNSKKVWLFVLAGILTIPIGFVLVEVISHFENPGWVIVNTSGPEVSFLGSSADFSTPSQKVASFLVMFLSRAMYVVSIFFFGMAIRQYGKNRKNINSND